MLGALGRLAKVDCASWTEVSWREGQCPSVKLPFGRPGPLSWVDSDQALGHEAHHFYKLKKGGVGLRSLPYCFNVSFTDTV